MAARATRAIDDFSYEPLEVPSSHADPPSFGAILSNALRRRASHMSLRASVGHRSDCRRAAPRQATGRQGRRRRLSEVRSGETPDRDPLPEELDHRAEVALLEP